MTAPNSSDPAPPAQPGGAFAPFAFPAFRAIWIANLFSSLGSVIQSVAAAWLMTELTTSHQLIALVQASATIPIMLLGLFAGAIADNFDRRRVMLAAQGGMLVVSAALAVMSEAGAITPVLLLCFTFAVGAGTALNSPAWQASVRLQVGPEHLPQAISLNTVAFNLARSVGPALGGAMLLLASPAAAFAINAVSYLAMIAVLVWWQPEATAPQREPLLASVATGLRFAFRSPPILRVLVRGLSFGFGAAGYQALVPALTREQFHGGEMAFGLLLGAFGLGSILAAIKVSALRRRWGSERAMAAATLLFIAALLVLARTSQLGWALPATFVAGAGWVTGMTSLNVAMQLRSPEAILGRCLSLYQAVTFGGMALGAWCWGYVSDHAGLTAALYGAAGFLAVTLVVLHRFAPMPGRGEGRIDPAPTP